MTRLAIHGGPAVRTRPFPSWPVFDYREEQSLLSVLRSGNWWVNSSGDVLSDSYSEGVSPASKVTQFARRFAQHHEVRYGIACANGTAALEVALRALGVGPGDEVIVPPYTFVATATAPLNINAVPIFCDIDYNTFNLSPAQIEKVMTPRTRAIIPVHFAGASADMAEILSVARRHPVMVLEDAAHGHGGAWNGKKLGGLADAATFSFQGSKNMTAGEGGLITTDDAKVAGLAESYIWAGREVSRPWYEHHRLGWNYRLTEFQAAILLAQLERLDSQTSQRMASGLLLNERLSKIPGLQPLEIPSYVTTHAFHIYVFRFSEEEFQISRENFLSALAAEGIPCSSGYAHPLYKNPMFLNREFYPHRSSTPRTHDASVINYASFEATCPNAEKACKTSVWLEHRLLLGSRTDIEDICRAIEKVWECRSQLQKSAVPHATNK